MLFVEEEVDGGVMPRSNLGVLEGQLPWECVTRVAEILYRRDREVIWGRRDRSCTDLTVVFVSRLNLEIFSWDTSKQF